MIKSIKILFSKIFYFVVYHSIVGFSSFNKIILNLIFGILRKFFFSYVLDVLDVLDVLSLTSDNSLNILESNTDPTQGATGPTNTGPADPANFTEPTESTEHDIYLANRPKRTIVD